MILNSRKLVSEKSEYGTLAIPPGLDPEGVKSSRSLSVDCKEPWMMMLFYLSISATWKLFLWGVGDRRGIKKK